MISGLISHLWQTTLFAGAGGLLVLALRKNQAHLRYWIWFIASAKFLIPFSLLVGLGALVPRRVVSPRAQWWVAAAEEISQPFTTFPAGAGRFAVPRRDRARTTLKQAPWLCGPVGSLRLRSAGWFAGCVSVPSADWRPS
jgi:bla regulator protein blaR1